MLFFHACSIQEEDPQKLNFHHSLSKCHIIHHKDVFFRNRNSTQYKSTITDLLVNFWSCSNHTHNLRLESNFFFA